MGRWKSSSQRQEEKPGGAEGQAQGWEGMEGGLCRHTYPARL